MKIKKFNDITEPELNADDVEKVDKIGIVQVTGILSEEEASKLDENIIINAGDFSGKEIKRGDIIWLSCLMKKPGSSYSANQQGVVKCRVSDIYLGFSKLNSLMK